MLLADKVAIVTGAAGGIGRAIALRFAKEGCDVVAADLNLDGANVTLDEIKKLGRDGLAIKVDVTNSALVQAMVEATIEKYGRIDILVNNAGTLFDVADPSIKSIADITEESWDRLIEINLKGCFLCSKYVVPFMKEKQYGKIVNFSTLGAIHTPSVAPHYNSAKAGVLGLTFDMASELASKSITVNAIMPGPIRTSFYDKVVGDLSDEAKETRFKNMAKNVPMQRMGTADEVASVALFFASELSSYVTGVQLLVAGGMPLVPTSL